MNNFNLLNNYIKPNKKVMATIGPTLETKEMILKAIENNCSWFRLPLGYRQRDHLENIKTIRAAEKEKNIHTTILLDLPSQRPRLASNQKIQITKGGILSFSELNSENTILTNDLDRCLPFLRTGEKINMLDGRVKLIIREINSKIIKAEVLTDETEIKEGNSFVFPDCKIDFPVITQPDIDLLKIIKDSGYNIDWIILSMINSKTDIINARNELKKLEIFPKIMSKIETKFAIDSIDEITEISDGILIGRGDLGANIPVSELPNAQKRIIDAAKNACKTVFVATQALETFASTGFPQRCELIDLASVTWLGADGIMLGKETVYSKHPLESIELAYSVMNSTNTHQMNWIKYTKNKKKENKLIAIEGPDGAGKTTLCNNIQNNTGAEIYRGVPAEWENYEIKTAMIKTDFWISSTCFFLSGAIEQGKRLQNIKGKIITDRSVWSTFAINIKKDPARFNKMIELLNYSAAEIFFPDLIIFLKPSYECLKERNNNKTLNEKTWDFYTPGSKEAFEIEISFFEWLKSNGVKIEFIDANRSIDDVYFQAKNIIDAIGADL